MIEHVEDHTTDRTASTKLFPGRLHDMLSYTEQHGMDHIISWVCDGKAFMVHDQSSLVKILPVFFGQTKYRSFQRQLNMWHFERIIVGPNKGAHMHACFVRGAKALCALMSRHKMRTASMYTQFFAIGTNQVNMDGPKQLRLDHNDAFTALPLNWSEYKESTNALTSVSQYSNQLHQPASDDSDATPTLREANENENSFGAKESHLEGVPNRTVGQEEDLSLLSEYLDSIVKTNGKHRMPFPGKLKRELDELSDSTSDQQYLPFDALAPGMEEPATPEWIVYLFAELSGEK